jgi:predicted ATP-grasp superfamily ATP-dependent carboligase
MLRPVFGTAGKGAARCATPAELRKALQAAGAGETWMPRDPRRFVVQRWVEGEVMNRASVAWQGREVAGFTRGRLATHPGPLGPGSVVRFVGLPAVAAATARLFALTGMHGLVGTQYIVERATGIPYLIEVNRRMLPATHCGALVGIDLAEALYAAVSGQPWTGPVDLPPGPGMALALFPQEWYRDPASEWLRTLPTDAPWDDPALFATMLRLGRDEAAATPAA